MKHIKIYFGILAFVTLGLVLERFGYISFSTKDHKISQNTELRDMFQSEARSADSHQRSAEQNWMDKYFNIKTD
jgi:hypothetical protein